MYASSAMMSSPVGTVVARASSSSRWTVQLLCAAKIARTHLRRPRLVSPLAGMGTSWPSCQMRAVPWTWLGSGCTLQSCPLTGRACGKGGPLWDGSARRQGGVSGHAARLV
ncbi:hypothetical protein GQ53DRAFT_231535 [Thozetella sp. PMI_491]|nr:hypothetical protein GQ53DRAFT_231535 [Thozetella sp. PMI_491]